MELSLQDAFIDIGVVSATFSLTDNRHVGQDVGGVLSPSSRGARLWFGSVSITPKYHGDMAKIESRFEELTEADGTFLICAPTDIKAVATTGAILSIDPQDRRNFAASDMPALTEGDLVGVTYGGGVRGLHRVRSVTTNTLRVIPPLALGVNVGNEITYGKPIIRAMVEPGSYTPPSYQPLMASGLQFSWRQVVRANA